MVGLGVQGNWIGIQEGNYILRLTSCNDAKIYRLTLNESNYEEEKSNQSKTIQLSWGAIDSWQVVNALQRVASIRGITCIGKVKNLIFFSIC